MFTYYNLKKKLIRKLEDKIRSLKKGGERGAKQNKEKPKPQKAEYIYQIVLCNLKTEKKKKKLDTQKCESYVCTASFGQVIKDYRKRVCYCLR